MSVPEPQSSTALHRGELSTVRRVVVCLALLLEGMSASSINVQIAAVERELGLGEVELQLVAAAFLVAYAGLLPAAGRLVDTTGARKVFVAGVSAFGVGCLLCAVAPVGEVMVAGRIVQGIGAALSAPAALALVTAGMPHGSSRNRAVALYGAMGALGFSLGLVVPGLVVSGPGWRASFLVSVPVVLVVLAVALTIRPRTASLPPSTRRPDLTGALLLTALLMLAVHLLGAVTTAPGWALAAEGLIVVGLVTALVRRGGGAGLPAVVVRDRRVQACCAALAAVFAGVVSSMYVLSLGLQHDVGVEAYAVGLLILPQPLAFSSLSGLGARLVGRYGAARTLGSGVVVLVVSLLYLGVAFERLPLLAAVLPAMAGIGAALALAFPAASVGAIDAAPAAYRGTTAGVLTASQNVGGALGLAVVTMVGLVPTRESSVGASAACFVAALAVVLGALVALSTSRGEAGRRVARPA